MKFQITTGSILTLFFMELVLLIILSSFLPNTSAHPAQNVCSCHDSGSYRIQSTNQTQLAVYMNETFTLEFHTFGYNVSLQYRSEAQDNQYFECLSNQAIIDNSIDDKNSSLNGVVGSFLLKAPATEGNYTVMIFAQSPDTPKPLIVCLEFVISVGKESRFRINLFDHMNIYIGGTAIILICVGTILYETKRERTQVHAWFTTGSLCLTAINIFLIWDPMISLITTWTNHTNLIDYWHLFHIVVGFTGLIGGMIAFFTGLAGFRTKKPGYVALICWTYCFVSGIIQWGIGI